MVRRGPVIVIPTVSTKNRGTDDVGNETMRGTHKDSWRRTTCSPIYHDDARRHHHESRCVMRGFTGPPDKAISTKPGTIISWERSYILDRVRLSSVEKVRKKDGDTGGGGCEKEREREFFLRRLGLTRHIIFFFLNLFPSAARLCSYRQTRERFDFLIRLDLPTRTFDATGSDETSSYLRPDLFFILCPSGRYETHVVPIEAASIAC
jgi:hypothetical protein